MPTARTCRVSFMDTENIRHSVEVTASTLYEAAVLASGIPALWIHGERTRTCNAAHSDGENAHDITRGAVEQNRGVASECGEAE